MPQLRNWDHERFARGVSLRLCSDAPLEGGEGEAINRRVAKRVKVARTEAYIDVYGASKHAADNARRLANAKDVRRRISELANEALEVADITPAWCLLQVKRRIDGFNVDDYLSGGGSGFERFFNIDNCTREELAKLSELSISEEILGAGEETFRKVRTTKIKPYDPFVGVALIAKLKGMEAPTKHELSGKDGAPLPLVPIINLTFEAQPPPALQADGGLSDPRD